MSKSKNKTWTISLKIGDNAPDPLVLYDLSSIIGEYLSISRNYFDELLQTFNKSKNYNIGKGIEKVLGKDEKEWTQNPWLLLLAKDKEKGAPFHFLIKRETDLNGFVVAVGPELFKDYLNSNRDDVESLRKIMEYLVSYTHKWELTLLVPNFLD